MVQTVSATYDLQTDAKGQDWQVITRNSPGNPQSPVSFGDQRARQIVFTKH